MGAKFVCFRCVIHMWRSNRTGFGKGLKHVTPHRFDSIGYQYGHLKKSFEGLFMLFTLDFIPSSGNM